MPQHIAGLVSALLLLTGTGFAAGTGTPPQVADEPPCIGIEASTEKWQMLYDSNPKPWPFLPLIVSNVNEVGAIPPGSKFNICRRVDRSTWNQRSAWLYVHLKTNNGNDSGSQSGWITTSPDEASVWISQP